MPEHDIEYRDYQVQGRDNVFSEFERGTQSTLCVLPTGTGKTVLAGMIAEKALEMGWRTLFLAHTQILVNQAHDTLTRFGFDICREMNTHRMRDRPIASGNPDVVVGSVQTLQRQRLLEKPPNLFDLIITDECHHAIAISYRRIYHHFNTARMVGITATPGRGDHRNLGSVFKTLAFEYKMAEAIRQEWLVPIRTRKCPVPIDLRGIKTVGGDFSLGELEEKLAPLVEPLCRSYHLEVGARPSVVFTPDVGSAQLVANTLSMIARQNYGDSSGMEARYVSGSASVHGQTTEERRRNLEDFNRGVVQHLVCAQLLIEGWDCPKVEAVGIMRPTLQPTRYTQMAGRATRPCTATGKRDALIIDYDWKTDQSVKSLASVFDLFDDSELEQEVYDVAQKLVREETGESPIDYEEIIRKAQDIVNTRRRLCITLKGRTFNYKAVEYDPLGVADLLGLKFNRKYDFGVAGGGFATEKQIKFLNILGVDASDKMSKYGASKLIDKLVRRRAAGKATPRQLGKVSGYVDPEYARQLSIAQADEIIRQVEDMEEFFGQ